MEWSIFRSWHSHGKLFAVTAKGPDVALDKPSLSDHEDHEDEVGFGIPLEYLERAGKECKTRAPQVLAYLRVVPPPPWTEKLRKHSKSQNPLSFRWRMLWMDPLGWPFIRNPHRTLKPQANLLSSVFLVTDETLQLIW